MEIFLREEKGGINLKTKEKIKKDFLKNREKKK